MCANPFMEDVLLRFENAKQLGEGALRQLHRGDWHYQPSPESTSIAVNVKHMHGNMVSRWTDFLTTDGNKPWRERDAEFETTGDETPEEILAWWKEGWGVTLATLRSLSDTDLTREVFIREMPLTVFSSILRQIGHYNYHIGQIVYLARLRRGSDWETLSIAKGASLQYEAKPTD